MSNGVQKAVVMAYGKNSKSKVIFRRPLYDRHTDSGSQNFFQYAKLAAITMDEKCILKQLRNHRRVLRRQIPDKSRRYAIRLSEKGITGHGFRH
jgi:hypothetical protein